MAQHGYLGDDYGTNYDPNWDDDRDDRERARNWRAERSAMFGERDRAWDADRDRFREQDRDEDEWFGGRRDWERGTRHFSSSRDDHYRSWRDKQVQALDRDYEDYCREREQQFHHDFDSWRQNRQQSRDDVSATRFDPKAGNEPQLAVDPESAATLGTDTTTGTSRRKS